MKNARFLLVKNKFITTVSNLSKRTKFRKVMAREYYSSIATKFAKIV